MEVYSFPKTVIVTSKFSYHTFQPRGGGHFQTAHNWKKKGHSVQNVTKWGPLR